MKEKAIIILVLRFHYLNNKTVVTLKQRSRQQPIDVTPLLYSVSEFRLAAFPKPGTNQSGQQLSVAGFVVSHDKANLQLLHCRHPPLPWNLFLKCAQASPLSLFLVHLFISQLQFFTVIHIRNSASAFGNVHTPSLLQTTADGGS